LTSYINLLTVGLALSIVGVIFLANSMAVRKPRRFIQEYFGIERPQHLRSVLDQLNAKAQIFCGFLALLVGFSLQISAAIDPPGMSTAPDDAWTRAQSLSALATGIVVLTAGLRFLQNAWSLAVFRRLMAEFFAEHPDWDFEKHPQETRELGELLGVDHGEDDSIGDYADRVRGSLGLAQERPAALSDDAFAPMRRLGSERRS